MNARSNFAALKHLTRDTFRQARGSGIGGIMLAVTAVCVALCLSVGVSGDVPLRGGDEPALFLPTSLPPGVAPSLIGGSNQGVSPETYSAAVRREGIETVGGRVTLGFGAFSFPLSRERRDAVVFLELLLAGGVAGTFGLLLALVGTAGFAPAFLEPGAASVLLAKPVERWQLLIGKYGGVLAFVGAHVSLFVGLTWLGLGVRTAVWETAYLWCIPLLLLQFAVYYSVSILIATVTRSTVASVFGSLLFWLLSWGINYGGVMARALPEDQTPPAATLALTDAAYWIAPKPIDAALILFNALDAGNHFEKPEVFKHLESGPSFSPRMSLLSCLVLTGVLLGLATYEFNATDY